MNKRFLINLNGWGLLVSLAVLLAASPVGAGSVAYAHGLNRGEASAPAAPQAEAVNLLENPGFEQGLNGWNTTSGSAVFSQSSDSQHGGSYSAKGVETSIGSLGRLYQEVTAKTTPGLWYQISGWIKTENVTGRVIIGLDYVTSGGWTPVGGYVREIGYVSGTSGWTYYTSSPFQLPAMPAEASALWFLFDFNAGNGIAYWDDVVLQRVDPAVGATSLHDQLAVDYPCGMRSNLIGSSLNTPPLVDTFVSFQADPSVSFKEAYLIIKGSATTRIPYASLVDPQRPGWHTIRVTVVAQASAIAKFLDLIVDIILASQLPGFFGTTLKLDDLVANDTSPIYGYVEQIVLVDAANNEYAHAYTNQLPLYSIYNRYLEPTNLDNWFGIRCSGSIYGAFSPVDLLLTDSQGRQTGWLPSGEPVVDIPNSYYSGRGEEHEYVLVYSPEVGSSDTLQTTGSGSGTYDLFMGYHSPGWQGSTIHTQLQDVATSPGAVHSYPFEIPLFKVYLPLCRR